MRKCRNVHGRIPLGQKTAKTVSVPPLQFRKMTLYRRFHVRKGPCPCARVSLSTRWHTHFEITRTLCAKTAVIQKACLWNHMHQGHNWKTIQERLNFKVRLPRASIPRIECATPKFLAPTYPLSNLHSISKRQNRKRITLMKPKRQLGNDSVVQQYKSRYLGAETQFHTNRGHHILPTPISS